MILSEKNGLLPVKEEMAIRCNYIIRCQAQKVFRPAMPQLSLRVVLGALA